MITKQELEKAKTIIKQYEIEQRGSFCSKCGKSIPNRWEDSANDFSLEIRIDCCSTTALFGRDDKVGFNHPAIVKENSGYQKVHIRCGKNDKYKLCWECHRSFVKIIGDFIKDIHFVLS